MTRDGQPGDDPAAPLGGRVVVLGSINADVFARVERHPRPGETVLGTGGAERAGGKGANQAVAAALSGAPVVMLGAVGHDAHAAPALAGLERSGCDIAGVRRVPGPTGLALITVAADGENSIIVLPGANALVGEPELARLDGLRDGDVLVLQGEVPEGVSAAAAARARDAGARVVVNLAPVVALPAETLRGADPLVVNVHEAAGAAAILAVPEPGALDPQALARALHIAGVPSVVMTLGPDGALVVDGQGADHLPAVPTAVVDTTGAGDAFTGALAAALADGRSLREAAAAGTRFAAAACAAEGAQDSYPGWEHR